MNHEPRTMNHEPRTMNHEPRTMNHEPRTMNHSRNDILNDFPMNIRQPERPALEIVGEFFVVEA